MAGKPAAFFCQGNWHHFRVDADGVLRETWGGPMVNGGIQVDGFAPNADVAIQVIYPDPSNVFGTYYGVSAEKAGGGVRSVYWVGSNWQAADHWEGPVDGP